MIVLINRTDAIGDSILTMPMASMIKRKYPSAKVIFLVSPKTVDVFKNHKEVDEVWSFDHKRSFFYKIKFLFFKYRQKKFTHYFHVGGSFIPSYVAWMMGISFRGGLLSRLASFLFLNKGVRQKRSLVYMHESEYNLNLLAPMGIEYHFSTLEEFYPKIYLDQNFEKESFKQFKKELEDQSINTNRPIIVIHPGMTGHTLNWPTKNYGRLIEKINNNFPNEYLFLISHTPSDKIYIDEIKTYLKLCKGHDQLDKSVYFFNGAKKGLTNYMSVLKNTDLFVGPSTGTTHIANSLNLKQIGIYSPIKVQSAKRWGPTRRGDDVIVITPDVICGEEKKCALSECPYYECMGKIEVDEIYQSFLKLLRSPNDPSVENNL